jgi:hypothetical protein
MVWYLLLAHFIADYPLQPNWMVRHKVHLWALSLHVGVHLIVMLAIVGQVRQVIWPQILVLALAHFIIDVGKNTVYRYKPEWVIAPYLIDQLFHYISIWLISVWIGRVHGSLPLPLAETWVILIIGYLLVTYVWYITENILSYANPGYRLELKTQLWSRMVIRAGLLTGLVFLWRPFSLISMAVPIQISIPYLSGDYRSRALLTDLGVVLAVLVFYLLAV